MSDWLAIGLGGASFLVPVVVVMMLVSRTALRLHPPEGWEGLPSPPRPLDVGLLALLPVCGSLAAGSLGAGLVVDALGAEADYAGALVQWAKTLGPLAVFACGDMLWDTLRKDRPRYAAVLRGEAWEPPPPRASSARMRGALLMVAVFAGAFWMIGLPEPEVPRLIRP